MQPEARDALRHAFDAMVATPQFKADAERSGVDLSPLSGERTAELARRVTAAPRDLVDRVKAMIAPKDEPKAPR
jgi:tripartite-type tricarboxylate transporter receptor subunit TctC